MTRQGLLFNNDELRRIRKNDYTKAGRENMLQLRKKVKWFLSDGISRFHWELVCLLYAPSVYPGMRQPVITELKKEEIVPKLKAISVNIKRQYDNYLWRHATIPTKQAVYKGERLEIPTAATFSRKDDLKAIRALRELCSKKGLGLGKIKDMCSDAIENRKYRQGDVLWEFERNETGLCVKLMTVALYKNQKEIEAILEDRFWRDGGIGNLKNEISEDMIFGILADRGLSMPLIKHVAAKLPFYRYEEGKFIPNRNMDEDNEALLGCLVYIQDLEEKGKKT